MYLKYTKLHCWSLQADKHYCEHPGHERERAAHGKQPKQCRGLQHKRNQQRLHAKARVDPSAQDVRDQAEHAIRHKRGAGLDCAHTQHLLQIGRHVAVDVRSFNRAPTCAVLGRMGKCMTCSLFSFGAAYRVFGRLATVRCVLFGSSVFAASAAPEVDLHS